MNATRSASAIRIDELIPANELTVTRTGTTKETTWPDAIPTTFTFDFTCATLASVMDQAMQNMIVSARHALKKTGYAALKANPICLRLVKDVGTRTGGITTAGMIANLAAKAANGTITHEDLASASKEAKRALLKAIEADLKAA